jgi:hypothetical protein
VQSGQGWQWVGSHIRPRIAIPESWHWPVGVSLSTEIGYQRPLFSSDTWTIEIRPIVGVSAGLEHYGSLGPVTGFDPLRDQQQILPVIDLNLGPQWEFNLGVGIGMTRSTDHLLVKMILGRRF